MHSTDLDSYMAELERNLRGLPKAQRREELAEMRSHLEEMIAAYQELGMSEEQAIADALRQFGETLPLARDLKTVYRKRVAFGVAETFGAIVGLYVLMIAVGSLTNTEIFWNDWVGNFCIWCQRQGFGVGFSNSLMCCLNWVYSGSICLCEGILLGSLTRRASPAIVIMCFYSLLQLAIALHQHPENPRLIEANLPYFLFYDICLLGGVWIANRWRTKHIEKKCLAIT